MAEYFHCLVGRAGTRKPTVDRSEAFVVICPYLRKKVGMSRKASLVKSPGRKTGVFLLKLMLEWAKFMDPIEIREFWIRNYPRIGLGLGMTCEALIVVGKGIEPMLPDIGLVLTSLGVGTLGVGVFMAGLDLSFVVMSSGLFEWLPHRKGKDYQKIDSWERIMAYGLLVVAMFTKALLG